MSERRGTRADDAPDESRGRAAAPVELFQPAQAEVMADEREPVSRPVTEPPPTLVTSGVIARTLGEPRHRVCRILETRSDIRPAAYVGQVRVFKTGVIARVRYELNTIDAWRSTRRGGEA